MAVTIEGTKVLTHYWLSCLNQSLHPGSRPPLFKVLDPRTSVLTQALQYFAALLTSVDGDGRLQFLWANSGYSSYQDFCSCMPHRVRAIRRTFMLAAAWIFRRHFAYLHRDMFTITLVGDPDAHPETLETVLRKWDRKHMCCVPQGLARDLKREGLTSSDLMSQSCWKEALFWTAGTVQLSCADIEAMHSQNRSLAGSAFHSIAARFINTESHRFSKEAINFQKGLVNQDCTQTTRKQCVGKTIAVDDCTAKKATPKGLSPLEIFRQRFLKTLSSTGSINPCSKECWAAVRSAWEETSEQEREIYRLLSEQSMQDAANARAQRARQNSTRTDALAVRKEEHAEVQATVHTQAVPLSDLVELVSLPDQLQAAVLGHVSQSNAALAQSKTSYPLGEAALERAWQVQRSKGISGKECIQKFRVEAERIARPSEDDLFPKTVSHESHCGSQCRHFSDRRRILLHSRLMEQFREIVTFKGGVKNVVLSDVLCTLA